MLGHAVGKKPTAESCGEDAGVSSEKSTARIEFNTLFAALRKFQKYGDFYASISSGYF